MYIVCTLGLVCVCVLYTTYMCTNVHCMYKCSVNVVYDIIMNVYTVLLTPYGMSCVDCELHKEHGLLQMKISHA